jgi:hypothetical protein
MKQLKTLLKELEFTQGAEYFDYMIESWYNGQYSQCEQLFTSMTNKDRTLFIIYLSGCFDKPGIMGVYQYYYNISKS